MLSDPPIFQQGGGAAPAAAKGNTAAAKKPKVSGTTTAESGAGSSLLAQKMADMAAKSAPAKPRSPDGMAARQAAWGKTGIIALRDLQLTALDPAWLEGGGGVL